LPECPYCYGDVSRMTRRSRRVFMRALRKVTTHWRIRHPYV
jgi:hypothetical protein